MGFIHGGYRLRLVMGKLQEMCESLEYHNKEFKPEPCTISFLDYFCRGNKVGEVAIEF